MNHIIYDYSLCGALVLLLFFGTYFLAGRTPDKPIFYNYIRSRRIMGVALLVLAVNYAVHWFFEPRFSYPGAAILMNLSTYYLCVFLFSSALILLLDRRYLTWRRTVWHLAGWLLFTGMAAVVLFLLPRGIVQIAGVMLMACWFLAYAVGPASKLIRTYRRAVRLAGDYTSDDIDAYIHWMPVLTYWAIIFGIGCGLFTFLPDKYVFIWILSSIPFYIYLYCSYMNYLLFYEQVEQFLETGMETGMETEAVMPEDDDSKLQEQKALEMLECNLANWLGNAKYIVPGLNIEEVAQELQTNRTYLADYIKNAYHMAFRDWITSLRLERAKRLMTAMPDMNIGKISEAVGFRSMSHFCRIFTEREGYTPTVWRQRFGDK